MQKAFVETVHTKDAAIQGLEDFASLNHSLVQQQFASLDSSMQTLFAASMKVAHRCHGILINSSEFLEPQSFQIVRRFCTQRNVQCLAVGPLSFDIVSANTLQPNVIDALERHGKERTTFISFGSFLAPTPEKIHLLAGVLKERQEPFIWSIRDLSVLPPRFEDEVRGFGVIVQWVDQLAILHHPGVGFILSRKVPFS